MLRLPGKMIHRRRPNASQNTRGVGDLIFPKLSSTTTALKVVHFGSIERVIGNLIVKNVTDVDTQKHLEKFFMGIGKRIRRAKQKESTVSNS